jgi:hypothetical protein
VKRDTATGVPEIPLKDYEQITYGNDIETGWTKLPKKRRA